MSEHWGQDAAHGTILSRGNGQRWDGRQLSSTIKPAPRQSRHSTTNAFPRLERNDSWASSESNTSSISSLTGLRRSNNDGLSSRRRKDSWDNTRTRSVQMSRRSYAKRDQRDQNEENWEREKNLEENDRNWAIEERFEENERNWAIEEKREENERNWETERKREENDRGWEDAREDHQLKSPQPLPSIMPRIVEPASIPRKPVAGVEGPATPIAKTETAIAEMQNTTTTGTTTDFGDDEVIPSPLRISRGQSWQNNSSSDQSDTVSLRAGETENWHSKNSNIVFRNSPVTLRGGGRDSESLHTSDPKSRSTRYWTYRLITSTTGLSIQASTTKNWFGLTTAGLIPDISIERDSSWIRERFHDQLE